MKVEVSTTTIVQLYSSVDIFFGLIQQYNNNDTVQLEFFYIVSKWLCVEIRRILPISISFFELVLNWVSTCFLIVLLAIFKWHIIFFRFYITSLKLFNFCFVQLESIDLKRDNCGSILPVTWKIRLCQNIFYLTVLERYCTVLEIYSSVVVFF